MRSKVVPQTASRFIPLSEPSLQGNEWKYVKECLDTNWVSSAGAFVERFESELAAYVGAQYGIATSNGTSALHVALLAVGVLPDDEVIVPTLTFIAPANAIRYVGAWPVFMDADAAYWQMDVEKLADFLNNGCKWQDGQLKNIATGRRVSVILPVHILGHPCDMDPIIALAEKFGLKVVEDATESLGAQYKEHAVGTMGHVGCFSFNGNKLLTTGGGGMVVTNDSALAERVRYLTTQAKDDPLEYVHNEVGFNYRLTNIQAAIGCAQLERIDEHIASKRLTAALYAKALGEIAGIEIMREAEWASSVFWMFTVTVDPARYGMGSRDLMAVLGKSNMQSRPLWQPLHQSPAHSDSQAWRCEVADSIYSRALSLPCSVGIPETDVASVAGTVRMSGNA